MKRANAVLFSLLMIVSSLAGCIGGEEVDTSGYEDQIAELEEMLEAQNQTIAQRDATIDGLEDGMSDAAQIIQDHAEGIAILEAYRDSLLVQLENSSNTSAELMVQLESANISITLMQSQIDSLESLKNSLYALLDSSNLTVLELEQNVSLLSQSLANSQSLTSQLYQEINELQVEASEWRSKAFSNDFSNLDFSHQEISHDMQGANFEYSNFSHSTIRQDAKIKDTKFTHADLSFSSIDTDITGTQFNYANLSNSEIEADTISAVRFDYSSLVNASLRLHDGEYLYFEEANLTGANFNNIGVFRYVYFNDADLSGAVLTNTEWVEAEFDGANLTNVDLTGAIFFFWAPSSFVGTIWDNTTCPDGTNSDDNGYTCENNM